MNAIANVLFVLHHRLCINSPRGNQSIAHVNSQREVDEHTLPHSHLKMLHPFITLSEYCESLHSTYMFRPWIKFTTNCSAGRKLYYVMYDGLGYFNELDSFVCLLNLLDSVICRFRPLQITEYFSEFLSVFQNSTSKEVKRGLQVYLPNWSSQSLPTLLRIGRDFMYVCMIISKVICRTYTLWCNWVSESVPKQCQT